MAKRAFFSDKDMDCFFEDVEWSKKLKSRLTDISTVRDKYGNYTFFSVALLDSISRFDNRMPSLELSEIVARLDSLGYQYSVADFSQRLVNYSEIADVKLLEGLNFLINEKGLDILSVKDIVVANFERNQSVAFADGLLKVGIDIKYQTIRNIMSHCNEDETVDMLTMNIDNNSMLNVALQMSGLSKDMKMGVSQMDMAQKAVKHLVDVVDDGAVSIPNVTKEVIEYIQKTPLPLKKLNDLLTAIHPRQYRFEVFIEKNPDLGLHMFNFFDWLKNQENPPKELFSDMQNKLRDVLKEKIELIKVNSSKPKLK